MNLKQENYTVSPKNVTTLIVNNFYTLEPILIISGTLYADTIVASKRM